MTNQYPILYEVSLQTGPSLAPALEHHMRREHIPAILRTGCFRRIRFDVTSTGRFRTCYQAETQADLDRYLQDHAPRLRSEFQERFPTGVTLSRQIWTACEVWESR
jgi:hypothetical protein